jgi:hypothetical protein
MPLSRACGVALALPLLAACDAYVEKSKYDEVKQKLTQTTKELDDSQHDVQKAHEQIGEYQAHRYQMFRVGFRTWRMDSVKGTSCIMLTTESDWNKAETSHQSCQCEDLRRNSPDASIEVQRVFKCIE